MVSIEELCSEVYEDLNPRIENVRQQDDEALAIRFTTEAWRGKERRTFTIGCRRVVDWKVWNKPIAEIAWLSDHPILWVYNCEPAYLHFTSAPSNAFEIVGRLYETHLERTQGWLSFRDYLNPAAGSRLHALLEGGQGMLASGPRCLLETYAAAIGQRLQWNINLATDTRYQPGKARKALILDDMYVICNEVTVLDA